MMTWPRLAAVTCIESKRKQITWKHMYTLTLKKRCIYCYTQFATNVYSCYPQSRFVQLEDLSVGISEHLNVKI